MKIKCKEIKQLAEGLYNGVILGTEQREGSGFTYTDIIIGMGEVKVNIGFPSSISEKSRLGELLVRFGFELIVDKEYDVDKLLTGKKCSWLQVKDGAFTKGNPESLKPLCHTKY